MSAYEHWRAQVADRWSELSLTLAIVPADENTMAEAQAIRASLCEPDRSNLRMRVPDYDQTYCAPFGDEELSDSEELIACLAEHSQRREDIQHARDWLVDEPFYGAVVGVRMPNRVNLRVLAENLLPSIWPIGGSAQLPGGLHVLVVLSCPKPRAQVLLPEGVEILVKPALETAELAELADHAITVLWPAVSWGERLFLRNALWDMASGRLQDLNEAAETLRRRLDLGAIRCGSAIAWENEDDAVKRARSDLASIGFQYGSPCRPIRTGVTEDELQGILWNFGLSRPFCSNWFEGLTSRAWVALGMAAGCFHTQRSVLDVIDRCLMVERMAAQLLEHSLDNPSRERGIRSAINQLRFIGHPRREQMSDLEIIRGASFGQLVYLLQAADNGWVSPPLRANLRRLVEARNQAAHGSAPSIYDFAATLQDSDDAIWQLKTLLWS